MPVFFVHDVNHGIVRPLDRKFRIREIEPVDELRKTASIHDKEDDPLKVFEQAKHPEEHEHSSENKQSSPARAIQAYQETSRSLPGLSLGMVKDIMRQPLIFLTVNDTLSDAWAVMQENDIHHLVILNEHQLYCGLLSVKTIASYLMNANTEGKAVEIDHIYLEEFCQQNLLSTHPETQLEELGSAMMAYGLDAIGVSEQGRLIGIVTKTDILKIILKHQRLVTKA